MYGAAPFAGVAVAKEIQIAERLPRSRPTAWCSLCASSKCTSLILCDLLKRDFKRKLVLSVAPDTNCMQPQLTWSAACTIGEVSRHCKTGF